MIQNRYKRRLSANERTLLLVDALYPPIVNQFVLEGEGVLDKARWQEAVSIAAAANPGMRVVLKGFSGLSTWVDSGKAPPVREVNGSSWDGLSPEGAPFLYDRLDAYQGPTVEILLIHGDPLRVMFRSLHASVDGRGQLYFLKDVFRVLNGKAPAGSDSTLTDYQFAKRFNKGFRVRFPDEHIAPTGKACGNESGVIWRRIRLEGKYPNILQQVCILTAREARRQGEGIVRFGIPVDMRLHDRKIKSTGNLVFGVTVEVSPETTVSALEKDILKKIQEKEDLKIFRGEELYRYLPLSLMKWGYKRVMEKRHQTGRYNITAYFSNIGYVQLAPLQGAGFKTNRFFPIPPYVEALPFFGSLTSYGDPEKGYFQELVITLPRKLATDGRFDGIVKRLKEKLENFREGT